VARREQNPLGVIGEVLMCALKASDSGKTGMIMEPTLEVGRVLAPLQKTGSSEKPEYDGTLETQGGMEPELQDHIGAQLRAVYNEVLNEPVPSRFLDLLADLERKQAKRP
jgi:hypothetical protein